MSSIFETYRSRKIEFRKLLTVNGWNVKVYSITLNSNFQSLKILEKIEHELPMFLTAAYESTLPTYKIAFLIAHEAREGVWILINWWTGGEMIETKVYFVNYNDPHLIKESPYSSNSLLCVWELEIFAHERKSWINSILKNSSTPDYKQYLNDVIIN
jgi:hypothetical protein